MTGDARAGLTRSLGPLGIMFLSFSALSPVVSVYLFGAGIIRLAGTGAVPALLIGGTLAAMVGLLYAELGAAFPDAGGVYPSFTAILGPLLSYPYVVMMLVSAPTTLAFSLLGFADYVRVLAPALPEVALACVVAAAGVAVLSIRSGAAITGLFLAVELAALATLTGVALLHPARSLVVAVAHPSMLVAGTLAPTPLPMIALATVASVFTCAGASWALYFAEEMSEAERRIGRVVTIISPLAALLIAGPLIAALLGAPDLRAVLADEAPVAAVLRATGGPTFAAVVSAGVLLAVFNAIAATIMGYGRLFYATARDGLWPAPLARGIARLSRRGSPVIATLVLCGAAVVLMALGERVLLVLCSNQLILEFLLLGVAVLVGRRRGHTGAHHRIWLHPAVPVLAILVTLGLVVADWLDRDAGRPSLLVLAAIIIASLVWRRGRGHSNGGVAPDRTSAR
ncbi:APC family permease [Sphingomonas bacterium]|uniref:APC family permease n=1 Tax=Sphingomonas bacterium TaxID=1895847 RepID=UPI00157614B3|nr:APC family permease [Sphingomonas bacterium]